MKYCPECGSKIVGIGKFCSECGVKLQADQPQPTQENTYVPINNDFTGGPHVNEIIENTNQTQEVDNTQVSPEQTQNGKAMSKLTIFFIVLFGIEALFLVGGIVSACVASMHWVLLLVGAVNFLTAFICYKVYDYRLCYICPKCGKKRVKHQRYLRTVAEEKGYADNNIASKTIRYTHYYWATYVCPNCGETFEREEKSSGGSIKKYSSGTIEDHRIDAREF